MTESGPERLVLALETTAPQPGAALARARGAAVCIVSESYLADGDRRAEGLATCVRDVLAQGQIGVAQLSALAVIDGPGSYTALRIGLALARGLALLESIPVVAVGALELVANAGRHAAGAGAASDSPTRVCALLDAGPSKVYAAGFELLHDYPLERHAAVEVADAELPALLASWGGTWSVCGDAALAKRTTIDTCIAAARAGVLARLGALRPPTDPLLDAERVLPRYVGATGASPNLPSFGAGRPVLR